jgi:phosphatidylglycerol:prolipoprotein diacylglycerol transferase
MISIQPYGLIISLSILSASLVCSWYIKRKKQDINIFYDLLFWTITGGILGARLYHVIHLWSYYKVKPLQILAFWQGGLAIYGAIFGGLLAIYIYSRIKNIKFLTWFDNIALGLPLGQAVGRWANFVNQELYGYPTNLPWKIYIKPENRLSQFQNYSYFHPLFLYESILSLITFFILLYIVLKKFDKKLKNGVFFCIYISIYSLGRFLLEFLKPDVWKIFKIPVAQIISLVVLIFCFNFLVKNKKKK